MSLLDTAAIFRYHKALIQQYGRSHVGALGWTDEEGQFIRFEVLAQIADLSSQSVLDLGCGHGDFCAYLHDRFSQLRYFGVEQIPDILQVAIERYGHLEETLLFQGDFTVADLPATDYILASGALSYRNSDPLFVVKAIEKLFHTCRKGLGFNLLSEVDPPNGLLVAYDPGFIENYCRLLTSQTKLVRGYRANDFTIFMYH
ncbi:MAG TPA: class I SAM-dependent methyltransferase [Sediminibacterium sp.]|nr:class I SAM-dependent methyltransferase [Sediminibacterium sp.]